jgi:hypothetical protein
MFIQTLITYESAVMIGAKGLRPPDMSSSHLNIVPASSRLTLGSKQQIVLPASHSTTVTVLL